MVVFGPLSSSPLISSYLGQLSRNVHPFEKNLGVFFDSELNFVKTSYCLRLISRLNQCSHLEIWRQSSMLLYHLDWIIVGISQSLVNRLQLVQNAAARLLTGRRKRYRITPILASLHWLPVRYRIDFKALVIFFKIVNVSHLCICQILLLCINLLRTWDLLTSNYSRYRGPDLSEKGIGPFWLPVLGYGIIYL